ncbi:hypothetical protein EV356DRAFT_9468 [Viridothelium virens]|uniref:Uncharacterized protein n=1 Tax=Viridothelium virens TaxID=1048519 RepID=A0A6A6HPJ1_VIRVR|nr:hypothetical protein EV356DRAFT_9468 [Viridothelium virens]
MNHWVGFPYLYAHFRSDSDDSPVVNIDQASNLLKTLLPAGASSSDTSLLDFYSAYYMDSVYNDVWSTHSELMIEWFGTLHRNAFPFPDHINPNDALRKFSHRPHLVRLLAVVGFAPNRIYSSIYSWESPLLALLRGIFLYHDDAVEELSKLEYCIDNLTTLIQLGADIHHIFIPPRWMFDKSMFEGPFFITHVATPAIYAITHGIDEVFETALRRCGNNPADVYAEDGRRCREFLRLQGAKSSAVQIEEDIGGQRSGQLRVRKPYADDSQKSQEIG